MLNSVHAVKLVLQRRPNVHIKNVEGRTALYYTAAMHHFKMIPPLLAKARDEDIEFIFDGHSTLHMLCVKTWQNRPGAEQARLVAVRYLLQHGCPVHL